MRKIVIATIIGALAVTPLLPTACVKPAEFEVSALNVSPTEVVKGEPATVAVDVVNIGQGGGTYVATLCINGVETETKEVTVVAGAKETVVFTVTGDTPGACHVELGGLSGTLRVLKPAEFELSGFSVPEEVPQGQWATITVDVTNIGEVEDNYTGSLTINGMEVATDTVTVAPSATKAMRFDWIEETPGSYSVTLAELTGTIKVRELGPAEFEVKSLEITPNPVKLGENVSARIRIRNVGESAGTYSASLLVDGIVEQTRDFTLAGKETKLVSFPPISKDSPGSYVVKIGGQEVILTVIEPIRLPTGTHLVNELRGGRGKLIIENKYDLDSVVVLCSAEEPVTPLLAFYVQSDDSYKASPIPPDTYVVYFALGEDWYEDMLKFLTNATYYRGVQELEFEQRRGTRTRMWTQWTITLDPAYGTPGPPISEYEFPSLG